MHSIIYMENNFLFIQFRLSQRWHIYIYFWPRGFFNTKQRGERCYGFRLRGWMQQTCTHSLLFVCHISYRVTQFRSQWRNDFPATHFHGKFYVWSGSEWIWIMGYWGDGRVVTLFSWTFFPLWRLRSKRKFSISWKATEWSNCFVFSPRRYQI